MKMQTQGSRPQELVHSTSFTVKSGETKHQPFSRVSSKRLLNGVLRTTARMKVQ